VRVTPVYFAAIGTKVVEGRSIDQQDTPSNRTVALVNQFFEKKFFKDGHAIGKHFSDEIAHPGAFEIVGVTEDTNYWGATTKMRPMYFLAQGQSAHIDDPRYRQFEDRSGYLNAIEIKTHGPLFGLDAQLRRAISGINPDIAVIDFQSFADQVDSNFAQQKMIAKLTFFLGLLALMLASIGLYGVTAYSVERRTREIGVRMALGANRMKVLELVVSGAFMQVGIGLALGIPATILAGRIMTNQLFGVTSHDPLVLVLATVVLTMAALLAAFIPARRAARTEPMLALRME
jgi:ABC-type antimicrobial peptide transport system permease subunit